MLYRLSVSPYAAHFVLKGGLLLQAVLEQQARATRDIDLLAEQLSNQTDDLRRIFKEICSIEADDGISFDIDSIQAEPITQNADYHGVSLSFFAYLDRTRERIHIDVGFGDTVIPNPNSMTYPSLLNTDAIVIRTYSLESIISEKFHAMVDLSFANSRMKDFYDIVMLACNNSFKGPVLQHAIQATFKTRSTDMPLMPAVFTEAFLQDRDKQTQWKAFMKRSNAENLDYADALKLIKAFLQPLYDRLITEQPYDSEWDYRSQAWRPVNDLTF